MDLIKIDELEKDEQVISPFAVRPGEDLTVQEVHAPGSITITPIDATLLVVINKYLLMSSRMVFQALKNANMQNITQKDVQHRLRLLTQAAFVQCSLFTGENDSHAATRVYSLGYRGRGYLKAQGIPPRLGGFVESLLTDKNTVAVKGYLAATQYLLNTSQDFHSTLVGQIVLVPNPESEKVEKIFRAFGIVQQDADTTLLIEPLRRGEIWRDYLPERLARIDATLNDKSCNYDFGNGKVRMILIAESKKHLIEINNLLCTKRYSFEILLTSDTMIHETPAHCLVKRKIPGFLSFLFKSVGF